MPRQEILGSTFVGDDEQAAAKEGSRSDRAELARRQGKMNWSVRPGSKLARMVTEAAIAKDKQLPVEQSEI